MRHWKQHWDPKAELVAKRRLRMGDDPKKPFVMPGEIISQAQREKLGANRLRRWFENGTLELADFTPAEPQRRLALQKRGEAELLPENGGTIVTIEEEEAGLDKVEEQARLERNAKAREKRASDKAAKAKRDERNRKAREKRAAARVNAGE